MKSSADSGYAPAEELLVEFKQRGFERLQDTSAHHARDSSSTTSHPSTGQKPSSAPRPVILDLTRDVDPDSIPSPTQKGLLQEALLDANSKLKEHLLNLGIDSSAGRPDSASWSAILHSAEAGNPGALTLVGYRYATGDHVRKSAIVAAAYYLRAIRYESSSASILLWRMAQSENFYPSLKKSVDAASPAGQFVWAGLTLFGFDRQLTEDQAVGLMAKAAKSNFTPAMVELGISYYTGASVPQDRKHAKELFDRAARLGSREALLRSSMMKINATKGMTPDKALLSVLAQSAEDGSVLADEMLGYFYSTGAGVPRNIPESVRYYRKAAQRGSSIAYNALRSLYDELRPSEHVFRMED
jgi:TPR repeat protein